MLTRQIADGDYTKYRAWLDKHFGEGYYTDDNEVVEPEGQMTVARITRVEDNGMRVEYATASFKTEFLPF